VPHIHVSAVGLQISPGAEVVVVEVEVDVLGVEEVHDPNARDGSRELAPGVQRELALKRDAGFEALVVALRG
jgi:hypothetical protein